MPDWITVGLHWLGRNATHLKDVAQVFAWAAAGAYFVFKTLTGYFIVNVTVSVTAERRRSRTGKDFLKVVVTIKKGDRGTFRLHDARVEARQSEKSYPLKLDIRRFSFRHDGKLLKIGNERSSQVPTLNFAPGEEATFSDWVEIDSRTPCSVEVVVLGTMFMSNKVGQWRGSTVSLPMPTKV